MEDQSSAGATTSLDNKDQSGENTTEDSVELGLKDQTITITGLSLEDAAKIILQEQEVPGHYQILTQEVEDNQSCVTVVQEVPDENMGAFDDNLEENGEAVYITQEMLNNGTIQMNNSAFYMTDQIDQGHFSQNQFNTVFISPGDLEASQKQTNEEPVVTVEADEASESERVKMEVREGVTEENVDFKTLHVNVIRIGEDDNTAQSGDQNESITIHVDNGNDYEALKDSQMVLQNSEKQTDNGDTVKYVAEGPDQRLVVPDDVKTIDLSKPIEVTDSTEIIIKGKKCVLMPNPDTGQLCAYPVVPPTAKKKRGRPKKSEMKEDQDYVPPPLTDEGGPGSKPIDSKIDQANAVEGLLELSNTGPDGVRRSGRAKKKKTLEDYELLEGSSDEESNQTKTSDEKDYIPPAYSMSIINTGVKRGRGRPRRYPPPGQTNTSSIPAVIIPGANGQTLMMAPIQGLQNFQAFQEQVKSLPSLLNKTSEGVTTINAHILTTSNGQIISSSESQILATSVGQILTSNDGQIITTTAESGDNNFLIDTVTSGSDTMNVTSDTGDISLGTEQSMEGLSEENNEENDDADLEEVAASAEGMVSSMINQDDGNEVLKAADLETSSEGQTILQIPEDLLPMFVPKKDPIKLGLKASEGELEKLKCPKCDFQAFYLQQYQTHIGSVHSDDVQKCKCCSFVSFDRDSLLKHFKETHPRCICTVCDFMAEHAYVIKRHMMRHSGDGCTCDICGKTYKDQYILKMHVKMVHMPADVLFECTVCCKKFTRKAHLKRHLRIHEAEKPYKCQHCEYRGCERSDISKHMLIHEEPKHVCRVCGKAFRHIKNKELHLKRHTGQKDYKCGVCDFYGYTFTDIRKHIERRHADIKTLVCDKCGSAFKSEALLREHQKQQCEVFMIEQGFSIATSTGGTSQATIQIPSSLSVEGQHITIDGQQITVEQFIPEEDISLTEDELRESLQNGTISEAQVIEGCQVEMGEEEEQIMQIVQHDMDTEDSLSMAIT